MKKLTVAFSVVAASVFMAVSANAAEVYNNNANKVDLYGKAVGKHYFSSNPSESGDKTYARLGFKGETQVNELLTGFGQWEYEFKGNNPESGPGVQKGNKTRLAFAGLKVADTGSLDYGRNYGVVYDALSYTDVLPEFGGDSVYNDNFFVGRNGGLLTYRNTNLFGYVDGLNFAIQYLGKNERDSVKTSNGDGVGGSISYENNGFSVVAAYASANRTKAQENVVLGKGKRAEQWATSVKYDANNVYLAATYGETRNTTTIGLTQSVFGIKEAGSSVFANKTQDISIVAQYQFDFGLRPSVAYIQSKVKDLLKDYSAGAVEQKSYRKYNQQDLAKYIDLGASYYFNKNMSTYVDYKINLLDKNEFTKNSGINVDDVVGVGLVYQF